MPTSVVVGTSLFQIVFLTAATTVLHASQNQNVDVVLAVILMAGGVIGAQFGSAGRRTAQGRAAALPARGVHPVRVRPLRLAADRAARARFYSLVVGGVRMMQRVRLQRRGSGGVLRHADRGRHVVRHRRGRGAAPRQGGAARTRRQGACRTAAEPEIKREQQPGARESVEADVSARNIAVTSSFNGTEIVIFGAIDGSQQPSPEVRLLRRHHRGGRRARPPRRAPQGQCRGPLAQYRLGDLRQRAELLRHRLDAPDGRDRAGGVSGRCTASA